MNLRPLLLPALAMAAIVLLSNILVQFPLNAWLTWGAFSYPVAYFVTDVCNRLFGAAPARRIAWLGFAIGLVSSAILAPLRIALASGTAFIVSQLLDVSIFNQLRRQSWWKAPFIGSCVASIVDTAIFFSLAFAGTEMSWLHLAVGDLGVKLAMALVLLPAYRVLINRLVTR
ncbi:MAG: queuosine precursor transporter [Opitutaceae bacterium]|nr:queuosine precursor transporter [Opitutaceae bacterium]